MTQVKRIALTGYAGCGKDEAALPLIARGYTRRAFGDIIKRQVDRLVQEHLGFSAFTDDRSKKLLIRGILEQWGMANYDNITTELFATMPEYAVNTRLCRVAEAVKWREEGGEVWLIERPGVQPATEWEAKELQSLRDADLIDRWIYNDGSKQLLHGRILEAARVRELVTQ